MTFTLPFESPEEITVLEENLGEPLKIILWNDEVNTFQWVIECLVEICDHHPLQAEQCAHLVHFKGKATVKHHTDEEKIKAMCTALCDRGLSATID